MSKEDIVGIIKEVGIVGMGGVIFFNYVKVFFLLDSKVEVVILNGVECELYLIVDYRLMVENLEDVVFGLRVLMKVLDVKKGFIGIEMNKLDVIEVI